MADYKDIVGTTVRNNDGILTSAKTGELFYDSTNRNFSYRFPNTTSAGAWRTGNSLNVAKQQMGQTGSQTSALAFGGEIATAAAATTNELYNGVSWTEVADLNVAKYRQAASGSDGTSALSFGGRLVNNSISSTNESWNGTSWTEVADLNSSNHDIAGGAGVSNTSALCFGGDPGDSATNESWNGTSWTEVADLNTGRGDLVGAGTATSALANGGWTGSVSALNESWNGTSWTEVADLNTARQQASAGGESNTSAVIYAGYTATARTGITETWNGTSFTEDGDMSTARAYGQGGAGTATSALAFGGEDPSARTAATEEWTGAGAPVGAWSTGGDLNSARRTHGCGVSNTSALAFSGQPSDSGSLSPLCESWNGTSWTEVADVNTARHAGAGSGIITSALFYGGNHPPKSRDETESWNGTSWTELADLNQGRYGLGGAGASNTSALAFSGFKSPPSANVALAETWNGTAWTEVNDLNAARYGISGTGTATAALAFAGEAPPVVATCEDWNGASWVEIADMSVARSDLAGAGTSTSALAYGGTSPSTATEEFDGSSILTKVLTD